MALLVEHGGAVNQAKSSGKRSTPLHVAVAKGHMETVSILLERHADKKRKDKTGKTPIMRAVTKHQQIAKMFGEGRKK